jgi:hypothetical protein
MGRVIDAVKAMPDADNTLGLGLVIATGSARSRRPFDGCCSDSISRDAELDQSATDCFPTLTFLESSVDGRRQDSRADENRELQALSSSALLQLADRLSWNPQFTALLRSWINNPGFTPLRAQLRGSARVVLVRRIPKSWLRAAAQMAACLESEPLSEGSAQPHRCNISRWTAAN